MKQQDIIWGEEEWEALFAEYRGHKDSLKSFLVGLGITAAGWGFVALCWWLS